jgi:hypothetical protein
LTRFFGLVDRRRNVRNFRGSHPSASTFNDNQGDTIEDYTGLPSGSSDNAVSSAKPTIEASQASRVSPNKLLSWIYEVSSTASTTSSAASTARVSFSPAASGSPAYLRDFHRSRRRLSVLRAQRRGRRLDAGVPTITKTSVMMLLGQELPLSPTLTTQLRLLTEGHGDHSELTELTLSETSWALEECRDDDDTRSSASSLPQAPVSSIRWSQADLLQYAGSGGRSDIPRGPRPLKPSTMRESQDDALQRHRRLMDQYLHSTLVDSVAIHRSKDILHCLVSMLSHWREQTRGEELLRLQHEGLRLSTALCQWEALKCASRTELLTKVASLREESLGKVQSRTRMLQKSSRLSFKLKVHAMEELEAKFASERANTPRPLRLSHSMVRLGENAWKDSLQTELNQRKQAALVRLKHRKLGIQLPAEAARERLRELTILHLAQFAAISRDLQQDIIELETDVHEKRSRLRQKQDAWELVQSCERVEENCMELVKESERVNHESTEIRQRIQSATGQGLCQARDQLRREVEVEKGRVAALLKLVPNVELTLSAKKVRQRTLEFTIQEKMKHSSPSRSSASHYTLSTRSD